MRIRSPTTLLPLALLACPWLGCFPLAYGPDDDDSSGDDDTLGDDDDAGDDDTGPAACEGDPFYGDPGGLPTGVDPCQEPALVWLHDAVDGDTVEVTMPDASIERIRLIGVDTPEYGDCYYGDASNYTADRLSGDCFWLTFDADCRDSYDRLLAYVHTIEGFLQVDLLEGGFAWTLEVEPNTTYAALFDATQASAEQSGAGLWSICD